MVEILEVLTSDPVYQRYKIEGTVPFYVKFKAEDGLLYQQQVWAKDIMDAYMQVMTGNYNDINRRAMEAYSPKEQPRWRSSE